MGVFTVYIGDDNKLYTGAEIVAIIEKIKTKNDAILYLKFPQPSIRNRCKDILKGKITVHK